MKDFDVAIIGAGFAGAATAAFLSQRPGLRIILLEQEPSPGLHASGQNASMIRQVVDDPDVGRLVVEGARLLQSPPGDWPAIGFRPCGSLLLAGPQEGALLDRWSGQAQAAGLSLRRLDHAAAARLYPVLQNGDFQWGLFSETDGVVDIQGLLAAYLEVARHKGVVFQIGWPVMLQPRGGEFVLTHHQETISAQIVVNAAGAWASQVAQQAGAQPIAMRNCRRHLFLTEPMPEIIADWPFIWDISHNLYFRPEQGGCLMSPCDEVPTDAPAGRPVSADEAMQELLRQKIHRALPAFPSYRIQRFWAGLRTLSPDGKFVIGWDAQAPCFFWVAGLGGHGVTASAAIGRMAAEMIASGPDHDPPRHPFSPKRFGSEDCGLNRGSE